ncbi:hypothetical protein AMECASPLE_034850 [Ameca splendens]|uniref:Uncharacterized protein n=1 Tax=Ameca splendens TaxID=208324 RepID=A0ABV0ZHU4_9TELE
MSCVMCRCPLWPICSKDQYKGATDNISFHVSVVESNNDNSFMFQISGKKDDFLHLTVTSNVMTWKPTSAKSLAHTKGKQRFPGRVTEFMVLLEKLIDSSFPVVNIQPNLSWMNKLWSRSDLYRCCFVLLQN